MLLDGYAVALAQRQVTRGPSDLLPSLTVVEVQNHGVRRPVQAGHMRGHSRVAATHEALQERPMRRCSRGTRRWWSGGCRWRRGSCGWWWRASCRRRWWRGGRRRRSRGETRHFLVVAHQPPQGVRFSHAGAQTRRNTLRESAGGNAAKRQQANHRPCHPACLPWRAWGWLLRHRSSPAGLARQVRCRQCSSAGRKCALASGPACCSAACRPSSGPSVEHRTVPAAAPAWRDRSSRRC